MNPNQIQEEAKAKRLERATDINTPTRLETCADIAAHYSGETPYDGSDLAEAGREWRKNFAEEVMDRSAHTKSVNTCNDEPMGSCMTVRPEEPRVAVTRLAARVLLVQEDAERLCDTANRRGSEIENLKVRIADLEDTVGKLTSASGHLLAAMGEPGPLFVNPEDAMVLAGRRFQNMREGLGKLNGLLGNTLMRPGALVGNVYLPSSDCPTSLKGTGLAIAAGLRFLVNLTLGRNSPDISKATATRKRYFCKICNRHVAGEDVLIHGEKLIHCPQNRECAGSVIESDECRPIQMTPGGAETMEDVLGRSGISGEGQDK